jgi:hypothetical protein
MGCSYLPFREAEGVATLAVSLFYSLLVADVNCVD